jgi:hypothetical protein
MNSRSAAAPVRVYLRARDAGEDLHDSVLELLRGLTERGPDGREELLRWVRVAMR